MSQRDQSPTYSVEDDSTDFSDIRDFAANNRTFTPANFGLDEFNEDNVEPNDADPIHNAYKAFNASLNALNATATEQVREPSEEHVPTNAPLRFHIETPETIAAMGQDFEGDDEDIDEDDSAAHFDIFKSKYTKIGQSYQPNGQYETLHWDLSLPRVGRSNIAAQFVAPSLTVNTPTPIARRATRSKQRTRFDDNAETFEDVRVAKRNKAAASAQALQGRSAAGQLHGQQLHAGFAPLHFVMKPAHQNYGMPYPTPAQQPRANSYLHVQQPLAGPVPPHFIPNPAHQNYGMPYPMLIQQPRAYRQSRANLQSIPAMIPVQQPQANLQPPVNPHATQQMPATPLPPAPTVQLQFSNYAQARQAAANRAIAHDWRAPQGDITIPTNDQQRGAYVKQLVPAFMDITQCIDDQEATAFKERWVKLGSGQSSYTEPQIETVCWKLVVMAEALHTQGPGSLGVFDQGKLKNIHKSRKQIFSDRIQSMCELLRMSKARCETLLNFDNMAMFVGTTRMLISQDKMNKKQNAARQQVINVGRPLVSKKGEKGEKGRKWRAKKAQREDEGEDAQEDGQDDGADDEVDDSQDQPVTPQTRAPRATRRGRPAAAATTNVGTTTQQMQNNPPAGRVTRKRTRHDADEEEVEEVFPRQPRTKRLPTAAATKNADTPAQQVQNNAPTGRATRKRTRDDAEESEEEEVFTRQSRTKRRK